MSTVKGSFTVVRDFRDVCYHTYFSVMDDLKSQGPPDAKYYEIRYVVMLCPSECTHAGLSFFEK